MQFTTARLLAFSTAISQALAVEFTNSNWAVTEGTPFTITWADADGAVTLLLKNGPSTDLDTVSTIASGQTGTSFIWTPTNLPSDTYAVEINDAAGNVNYGSQFVAGSGVATTTSTTASATTSTTEASTSTTDSSTTTTTGSSSTLTTAASTATGNSTSTASSTGSTSTRSSSTSSTSTAATGTNTPLNTSNSKKLGSPLALVLLTVAAMMLCH